MSETDQPITQKQNSLIWEGLQVFRKLAELMTAARCPERLCAALHVLPAYQSRKLQ